MAKQIFTLKFKNSRGRKRVIAKVQNYSTEREAFDMVCALIGVFCKTRGFNSYYTRFYNSDTETVFDVGRHSEFFHVVPPMDLTQIIDSEQEEQNEP